MVPPSVERQSRSPPLCPAGVTLIGEGSRTPPSPCGAVMKMLPLGATSMLGSAAVSASLVSMFTGGSKVGGPAAAARPGEPTESSPAASRSGTRRR